MLVHRLLEDSASRQPNSVALLEGNRTIAYGELNRLANRFANLLREAGVARHDRVAIALDNSIEMVAAYLGTMKAGAAAVPLPAGPRSDRLAHAVADCTPAAAIVDAATALSVNAQHPLSEVKVVFVSGRAKAEPGAAGHFRSLHDAVAAASDEPSGVRGIDLDLAAIIYTSGSTGAPRGVMLTHRNIVANTRSIVAYLQLTSSDRVMCVLPFYYVYGLSLLHTHLAVGASTVIDNRFAFPNTVLQAMRTHEVTGFAGVPSTFALLLQRSNIDEVSFTKLRYITQAGGNMPTAHLREWMRRGPRVPFFVMYGATEASARLTYLEPDQLVNKMGSIGRAIPNVEIVVRTEDGRVAAPGEAGELVARGANISIGYWNDGDETARKFDPFGYRTGDLGYMDEDGYLFLVGRRHDMIKVGAHRVGPMEIEQVLHEYSGVHEAAVVAAPHDVLGEAPLAFVVVADRATADADAIRNFCKSRLAAHKVPVRIVFRDQLPKLTGSNKIDRVALRGEVIRTSSISAR
jgi:amino acid adenylation domain-containing protein